MSELPGRVVLAAGGTAGHVYPALAVAEELRSRGERALFVLPEPEFREVIESAGFECAELPGGPWLHQTGTGRARTLGKVISSVARGARSLRRWGADVVLGFGSYGSVAPVIAATMCRIPAAILEPNAVPGLANRILAKFSPRVYLGGFTRFPAVAAERTVRTGMPVRKAIETVRRETASTLARILVLGDPRRSGFLDTKMPAILSRLADGRAMNVVHLTEDADVEAVRHRYGGCPARVASASTSIHEEYAAADLVICRAGASTLAELAIAGLPSLLVPLASAAEDHQTRNAEVLRLAGAAMVRHEQEWSDSEVADAVSGLIEREGALDEMSAAVSALGVPGAAARLVDDLLTLRSGSRT